MTSCIFYGRLSGRHPKGMPWCTLTTYATCDPSTCPWYKSEEMMQESYEKARQNYLKKYGRDDYYKLGYGPKVRHNPPPEIEEEVDENERVD
jgi:hypothetical protein